MNTSIAAGNSVRICSAPCQSISSTTSLPAASSVSTLVREVPYQLPCTWACSKNWLASTIWRKCSTVVKWYSTPSRS